MAVPTEQKKREARREAKAEIAVVLDRVGYLDSLFPFADLYIILFDGNQMMTFVSCSGPREIIVGEVAKWYLW